MPRRRAGEPASRFGTRGAIGRAARADLAGVQASGVQAVRLALAQRLADAADTAAASGDVRSFLSAAKLLEDVLGRIGGGSGGIGVDPVESGGAQPVAVDAGGLGGLMGAGATMGDQ